VLNSAGVASRAITNIDLLDLKCVAISAVAANRILTGVRLRKVEMWCANSSSGSANTIQVEMQTANPYFGNDSKLFADTAVGTTNVAHVCAKPPRGSFADAWLPIVVGTAFEIFNVTGPQGSIIDVHLVVTFADDEAATSVSGAVAAATAGILYTRKLDSTNASPLITPIGVITI